jgi:hypothetical protein
VTITQDVLADAAAFHDALFLGRLRLTTPAISFMEGQLKDFKQKQRVEQNGSALGTGLGTLVTGIPELNSNSHSCSSKPLKASAKCPERRCCLVGAPRNSSVFMLLPSLAPTTGNPPTAPRKHLA